MPLGIRKKDWVTYVPLTYVGIVALCCFMAPSGVPSSSWLLAVLLLTLPWSVGYGILFAWAIAHDGMGIIIIPALIAAGLNAAVIRWLLMALLSDEKK